MLQYSSATEEVEGENEELNHKRKPWGDTLHFCPVALNENAVLWPGNQETAVRLALTVKVLHDLTWK